MPLNQDKELNFNNLPEKEGPGFFEPGPSDTDLVLGLVTICL
jgi:hypothetical protein